ncbi:MAG: hypothetical protein ACFHVJ_04375 [Aestuariibacter sp.]
MKVSIKLIAVTVILLMGWAALIWVQWQHPLEIAESLLGIPLVMVLMAALAALAAQDTDA